MATLGAGVAGISSKAGAGDADVPEDSSWKRQPYVFAVAGEVSWGMGLGFQRGWRKPPCLKVFLLLTPHAAAPRRESPPLGAARLLLAHADPAPRHIFLCHRSPAT